MEMHCKHDVCAVMLLCLHAYNDIVHVVCVSCDKGVIVEMPLGKVVSKLAV